MYGFLSDRTRSRWGRRRPWLAIGTPLLVLCFIAFYSTPAFVAGLANAFYSAAMSLVLASMPFFVKYMLNIPDGQSTLLFAAVLLIAIGCVSVWARLVRRYSLIPVWRAALAALMVAFIPPPWGS